MTTLAAVGAVMILAGLWCWWSSAGLGTTQRPARTSAEGALGISVRAVDRAIEVHNARARAG